MSDTFTARTGRTVAIKSRSMTGAILEISGLGTRTTVDLGDVATLREFFQHERDKELGRWRWPDNRDYTVRVAPEHAQHLDPGGKTVAVEHESTGYVGYYSPDRVPELTDNTGDLLRAVHAYFAAHPEPRPWHDAKPGEVWEMTFTNGQNMIGLVTKDGECFVGAEQELTVISSTSFTVGRRIWPEVKP